MIGYEVLTPENVDNFYKIIDMIYKVLDIIRIVVPIGLIVMTTLDITKKVINPEDKEGQKKILIRAIAALIVFLLPTIIRIVLRLAGMDQDIRIDLTHGIITNDFMATPAPVATVDPNLHITGFTISGCPNVTKTFHKNEIITLDTTIPSTYTGDIKWSIIGGDKFVSIREMNGGKSAQISVLDVSYSTSATINVIADGKSNSCKINLEKETLSSVKLNCPSVTKTVGDKVDVTTNIPKSFTGDISWKVDDTTAAKMIESSDKKNAKVELFTRPKGGTIFITLVAGGAVDTCHINIKSVENLEITNCPNNRTFHVGDKITLTTNLPSTYKGPIEWTISSLNDAFTITPSASKREAIIEVIDVPTVNRGTAIIAADGTSTNCQIKVE